MNPLFLHTSSILGGSERSFLDLLTRLAPEWAVEPVIVLPSEGPLREEVHAIAPQAKILKIPFPGMSERATQKHPWYSLLLMLGSAGKLKNYFTELGTVIDSRQINTVYTNGIKCHLTSLVLKRKRDFKLIWHLQDFFPELAYVKAFMAFHGKGPDAVIANSNAVLDKFKPLMPKAWTPKLSTVYNAVDQSSYRPGRFESPEVTVTIVGMLTPWKGQHLFIRAATELAPHFPEAKFLIVGDEMYRTHGERGYKKHLRDLVRSGGLEGRVEFTGFLRDLTGVYARSDIVVHASLKPEPFGRVIIEAMSCEKAVIATRGGGVPEIVRDGVDGILVDMGDGRQLTAAIRRLLEKKDLRSSLGRQARQRVLGQFTADRFAAQINTILRSL
ncbi:MAG: glycosyltransferase family 4 protein [Bdellovibrionia bacterium]